MYHNLRASIGERQVDGAADDFAILDLAPLSRLVMAL
jgi:hypothetical protein